VRLSRLTHYLHIGGLDVQAYHIPRGRRIICLARQSL
jgi:hypothetical protein